MAVHHVKSNTVADFTGTVTVFNNQGSTATLAATDLVRPVDWNSYHAQDLTISGNTAGQSTASGTNIVFGFTGDMRGSLSTAANAATLWLSEAGAPASFFRPFDEVVKVAGQVGQSSIYFYPVLFPDLSIDRYAMPVNYTNTTNSSNSFFVSFNVGLYTLTGSTLSLHASTSVQYSTTNSGTVGAMTGWLGNKAATGGWTTSFPAGNYWIAVLSRTTTSGGAGMSMSQFLASQINSAWNGNLGAAPATSNQPALGMGVYSAQTAALPNSVGFNQIIGTTSVQHRPPVIQFLGTSF